MKNKNKFCGTSAKLIGFDLNNIVRLVRMCTKYASVIFVDVERYCLRIF